jgi:hypothetical protein
MFLLLTQMVLFGEIHVFHKLRCIGVFGINTAYLHLQNSDFQEAFIPKTNSVKQGNNMVDAPASSIDGFLWRNTSASSTQLNRLIWNIMSLSPP